ncbi:hypothetical protein Tco_0932926 [Tanacetum coccineum]
MTIFHKFTVSFVISPSISRQYETKISPVSKGRSSNASAIIDLRADEELKDSIMVAMPKLAGEGFNMCTISVNGQKKQDEVSRQEVSNSNPFEALNLIKNDDDLGTNEGNSKSARKGSLNVAHVISSNTPIIDMIDKLERQILDGKVMFVDDDGNPLVSTSNVDIKSEVKVVFDETGNLMASTSFKGATCDDLDITVCGRKKK